MTSKERLLFVLQTAFGYPILLFALAMIYLDASGAINVEKFGYAFFGGLIVHFMNYFFRKGIKKESQ